MITMATHESDLSRRDVGVSASVASVAISDAQATGAFTHDGRANIAKAVQKPVEDREIAGAVTLTARGGETLVNTFGVKDLETGAPMRRDTIFRIASMTKPICAAAAMILVEEGKLALDAPVDRWLPELANRKVLRTIGSALDDTVSAQRAITLRDLMTLRMGIGMIMQPPGTHPIQTALSDAGLLPSPKPFAQGPDAFMQRLGALPLMSQPGERWMYHTGFDVLGVLIARATGVQLSEFLQARAISATRKPSN
jgi:CubicO group peptidase (beta-lactamase class C family)